MQRIHQRLFLEGKFIHLNENIEGEYYGLPKRGLYFFVVRIGEVPMRFSWIQWSTTAALVYI